MLHIAVCEDQKNETERICEMVRHYQADHPHLQIQTDTFTTAEDLVSAIEGGNQYHLFLLDIIMPGMNGISLARTLCVEKTHPAIIFVTTSREYAVEAFSVRAVDYLVKPIDGQSLYRAFDNALEVLGNRVETYTSIRTSGLNHRIKISQIICVEVVGHSLCYHLANGEKIVTKVLRISFEQATQDLQEDVRFIRPHRSFLINAAYVVKFSKNELLMENQLVIPISRLRFPEVKQEYIRFLNSQDKTTESAGDVHD